MSKIAVLLLVLFKQFFFFLLTYAEIKGFLLAENSFFSLSQQKKNRSKRTAEKNRLFGSVNRLIMNQLVSLLICGKTLPTLNVQQLRYSDSHSKTFYGCLIFLLCMYVLLFNNYCVCLSHQYKNND